MVQNFSLHTHTIGFDGRNTVEEMVQTAQNLKWQKIGISNHFIVHPFIKQTKMYAYAVKGGYNNIYSADFDEAIKKFEANYLEIEKVKQKTGFPIYKGMEVDFFAYNGWREGFERAREILKPDYIIGSAHFVAANDTLYNSHDLKNAVKEEQNMLLYKYYQNVRAAAQSGLFDFLAHLDLLKKVGLGREDKWEDVERLTVETLAKSSARAEINTSGFKLEFDEPYPGPRILKLFAQYHIPVILSDDAHKKENLGNHFEKAFQMARDAGIQTFFDPFEKKPIYLFNQNSR